MPTEKVFYLTVTGLKPRKRKREAFSLMIENKVESASSLALKLITENKLREPVASVQLWSISRLPFKNAEGKDDEIIMRSIFPSGEAIPVDITKSS